MGKIIRFIEDKKQIIDKLSEILDKESINKAILDHHSIRRPRPCGITIHTGIGCSIACSYCYIYDMGFPAKVRPYPLTALELVYALARNPYIVPHKTFAAYGSVTEPFLSETRDKAIMYIANVYKWLFLPSQISTKISIDDELAKKLKNTDPSISVLITLVTIDKASELEGFAPSPLDRLKGIQIASRHNLSIYLFIRPIIPGVTDRELNTIIKLGAEYNVKGVVFGSLRITNSIIQRLRYRKVAINEIINRVSILPRGREQVLVKVNDIINRAKKIVQDYGLKLFRSACMANIDSHDDYCYMCSLGPCGNINRYYKIEYNDISEYLEVIGIRFKSMDIKINSISIVLHNNIDRFKYNRKALSIAKLVLAYISRRKVVLE